jgi:hypothetical protein
MGVLGCDIVKRKFTDVLKESAALLYRVEEYDSLAYSVLQLDTACSSEESVNVYQRKWRSLQTCVWEVLSLIFSLHNNYPD